MEFIARPFLSALDGRSDTLLLYFATKCAWNSGRQPRNDHHARRYWCRQPGWRGAFVQLRRWRWHGVL